MGTRLDPFSFLVVSVAGWLNQRQQHVIEYLLEENRLLEAVEIIATTTRLVRKRERVGGPPQLLLPRGGVISVCGHYGKRAAGILDVLSLRTLNAGGIGSTSEGKFEVNRYLRERGDANIKSNADLIAKSRFYTDSNFPDRKQARERDETATALDTSVRLQGRFAAQTMLLQCMQDQQVDALVSPMSTVPPRKLTSRREPAVNGRTPIGWSLIGQQGFPAITVPAGFTTAVWDRVADNNGATRLIGPVPASLTVGVDFIARPFGEPLLFRIASAYEAATHHRRPPPDFGPVR
jgi:amidase